MFRLLWQQGINRIAGTAFTGTRLDRTGSIQMTIPAVSIL